MAIGTGFGFAAGVVGLHPVLVSLFAFASAVVKLGLATVFYKRAYSAALLMRLFGSGQAVIVVGGERVLGILTKLDLIEYLTSRLQ